MRESTSDFNATGLARAHGVAEFSANSGRRERSLRKARIARSWMWISFLAATACCGQRSACAVETKAMGESADQSSDGVDTSGLVRPVGMSVLAHPEYLPLLYPPGTETKQFSSYDLAGGNNDGNFSRSFAKYVDANGEYVIFDAYGPGSLNRQQINLWQSREGAGACRIRFYFDDEPRPRIDLSVDEFFGGSQVPFDRPFSFVGHFEDPEFKEFVRYRFKDLSSENIEHLKQLYPSFRVRYKELTPKNLEPVSHHGSAFAIHYYPLPFARRLKVTFVPTADFREHIANIKSVGWGATWYQFTYLLYPPGTRIVSWSQDDAASAAVRASWGHVGNDPKPSSGNVAVSANLSIPSGASAVLLSTKGQGAIASLKLRLAPFDDETFFGLRIRMSWDVGLGPWGGGAPLAVDMPIGVFFGGGGKGYVDATKIVRSKLTNLLYGYDGAQGTFYCYWPMPYWSSAKIEVFNGTGRTVTMAADVQRTPTALLNYPAGRTGYFYAKETENCDRGDGLFATAFREQGYGHVVGIGFFAQSYPMDGDEFTYFDGSRTPQIHGDGAEDDHNQGWGGAGYQQPLWGGLINGIQGAYRIYLNDSYVFDDQVKINYEYSRTPTKTNAKTDAVIYYYKTAIFPRLVQTDALDVGLPESERAHDYVITGQTWEGALRSAYDGYEKNVEEGAFLEEGRAFNGSSSFTVAVDPKNDGVRIRRLLSRQQNGVQTAEVYVDGLRVERPWHVVFNSSAPENQVWVDSDFELPASLTHGKSQLRVELKYVSSTKGEINEFHYWVFCHLPL